MNPETNQLEQALENSLIDSFEEVPADPNKKDGLPEQLYIFPLIKRPFFPGMAAPIVIEPGPFYDILKIIARSDDKCVGLLLSRQEDKDIYSVKFDDLIRLESCAGFAHHSHGARRRPGHPEYGTPHQS